MGERIAFWRLLRGCLSLTSIGANIEQDARASLRAIFSSSSSKNDPPPHPSDLPAFKHLRLMALRLESENYASTHDERAALSDEDWARYLVTSDVLEAGAVALYVSP